MARVRLVHWNAEEADERATRLSELGHAVDAEPPAGPAFLKELEKSPPDLVLIDLSRIPSQGRDLAVALRTRKGTRGIPIAFVGGAHEKVSAIREILPDAAYLEWDRIDVDLEAAIEDSPDDPVNPGSVFAAYGKKPLAEKLGLSEDTAVALIDAPDGFRERLDEKTPRGVRFQAEAGPPSTLALWFVRSVSTLEEAVPRIRDQARHGPVWIVWPKKASPIDSDLSQTVVRETGLAAGLVDYKICRIDDTWSGLLFTLREGT